MGNMIEQIAKDAYKTEYFWKLYKKVNLQFTQKVFHLYNVSINEKELIDILRFADIFSNSKEEYLRNIAYKIISLLFDNYNENIIFNTYATAVLKKLNNFPALNNTKIVELPVERELQFLTDREVLQSPIDNERYFLPNQYKLYQFLQEEKSLTFAGPTSMGKSYVIKQFILDKVVNFGKKYNYCIIVPSRALIKQYVSDLNYEFNRLKIKNYKIVTNANVLEFIDSKMNSFVFVLTQERLNVLLFSSFSMKLDYMIIDEAYKVYDTNVRGLTLYSALDACFNKFKDIKVLFASPLISNPEIFQDTFNKSLKSYINDFKSSESPVGQNLFYVNIYERSIEQVNEINEELNIKINDYEVTRNELYYRIGRNDSNIIYLSSQEKAICYSREFADYLKKVNIQLLNDEEKGKILELCNLIEKNVHKDYFLIELLKSGIAYHYGKLPSIVRESIENLFKEGVIKYLFCTSTLLEGVNLPAKNIFIMANYIGRNSMKPLEFWNLAGRAGRLGYEYYGNVFCVNDNNHKKAWKKKEILYKKDSIKIEDNLESKIKEEKQYIKKIISDKEPVKDLLEKKKYANYLANIIQIDTVSNNNSIIVKKVNNIEPKIIESVNNITTDIDYNWINSNKTIDFKIQERLFKEEKILLTHRLDYKGCLETLLYMYQKYSWNEKEQRLSKKETLKYIALLMSKWINGCPLNEIIESSVLYYDKNKKNIKVNMTTSKRFSKNNSEHINILINQIITDIENILRFDLEKYFNHYYHLTKLKYGEENCGYNIALYLEFGTRNKYEILLQNAGFSRYSSHILRKYYYKYICFENNIFKGINKEIFKSNIIMNSIVCNEIKVSSYLI